MDQGRCSTGHHARRCLRELSAKHIQRNGLGQGRRPVALINAEKYTGFDAICEGWAKHRNCYGYPVTYLGSWEFYDPVRYPQTLKCHADNTLDKMDYVTGSFYCEQGSFSHERPDGCYEQKDVTQECQTARENLLQHGTPLPGYCAEFAPNDSLCQQMPSVDSHVGGRVACTDIDGREYLETCFFSERLPSYYGDAQARQMIGACIIEHENVHAEDETRLCIDKRADTGVGTIGFHVSNKDLDRAERNAYMQETDCLLSKKEFCMTQQCQSEINDRIVYTIGKSVHYTNNLAN